jgi:YD repeat-containing protein
LTYTQELYDYFDLKNQYLSNPSFTGAGIPQPEFFIDKTRINGVRLTQIHTSEYNTKVLFQANTVREDVGFESDINNPIAYRLDEIHVLSDGGTGFKKFIFNYEYFVSTGTSILPVGVNAADFTRDKKRLKLLSVREQSYDGSIMLPAHQFEYNTSINIPRRISFGRDHWGYYNGKENYNRSLIHQRFYSNGQLGGVDDGVSFGVPRPSGFNPFLPSDRSTDELYTKFASLTRIIYPTGGSTVFDMESHVNGNFPTIPIGGLRIKTIKNNDSDGTIKTQKNFDYLNSGTLFSKPTYYFQANLLPNVFRTIQPPIGGSNLKDIASSSPVLPLSTTQGSHIGYNIVKISEIGNGSTTYTYNISGTYPTSNGNSDFFGVDRLFNYPLDPLKDNYRRGQLEKEEVRNEIGILINEIIYNYTVDEKQVIIPAIKIDANTLNGYPSVNLYNRYAFFTGRSDLTSKTVTTCSTAGTNCVSCTSTYTYDSPNHFQMTNSTEESSNGELVVSKLKYAQDYTYSGTPIGEGGATILALKAKNIVTPIESNMIRKAADGTLERVVSGGITFYDNTVVKPTYSYSLETTEAILSGNFTFSRVNGVLFEKDGRYPVNATQLSTYYTNSGNPKESFIRESTNQVTTYLWGYNHALPIAEIKNANYATVVGVVGQAVIDNLASTNNLTDAQIRSALAPLYSLSNALTTIYTYNPLIGITSVTPPDGLISTYEYDKLGRLQFIKNNKGEIVKGYKYGYKSN